MSLIPTKVAVGVSIPIRMVLGGPMGFCFSSSISTICRSNRLTLRQNFFWMRRAVVVFFLFPGFFFGCSPNNVTVDDRLGRYFDSAGVKGSFGLFDNGHGHFTIYNLPRYRDSFYSPGQTFDILQSLIAIQEGIKKDDSAESDTPIPYGIDTSLHGADSVARGGLGLPPNFGQEFRDTGSTNGLAFLILVQDITRDTVQKWIDSLQYGNRKTKDRAEFWLDGTLRINCDQQ